MCFYSLQFPIYDRNMKNSSYFYYFVVLLGRSCYNCKGKMDFEVVIMKEKMKKISDIMKATGFALKESMKRIQVLNKFAEWVKKHQFFVSIGSFCVVTLILILVATVGWMEAVVPVCILFILEALMALLLHRAELWIHAVLLVAQVVMGIVIDRLPLDLLCVLVYLAATATLHFAFPNGKTKEIVKPAEDSVATEDSTVTETESEAEEQKEASVENAEVEEKKETKSKSKKSSKAKK